ncbi:MAG: hypothetical protein AB8I08_17460 [Sandaracinaceae bacterium]
MAERARSEDDEGRGRRGKTGRLGRWIANSIVVAGLAYLILSGLFSVIPQIFWPERAELDSSVTCTEEVVNLRSELLAHFGERVSAGGHSTDDLTPWLRDWDQRHAALADRCDGAPSHSLLGRLRERLESDLSRFEAGAGDLDRALIDSLPPSSIP